MKLQDTLNVLFNIYNEEKTDFEFYIKVKNEVCEELKIEEPVLIELMDNSLTLDSFAKQVEKYLKSKIDLDNELFKIFDLYHVSLVKFKKEVSNLEIMTNLNAHEISDILVKSNTLEDFKRNIS